MNENEFDVWLRNQQRPPLVMGVLNVTPDSFSDGGAFASADAAIAHGMEMIAAGAHIIDIGGESTRPGAQRIDAQEQLRRILPAIRALAGKGAVLSVDTTRAGVAEAALEAGAYIVNDISAGVDDPAMLPLVGRRGVPVVLMHMKGQPADMQLVPSYADVVAEVKTFLEQRMAAAMQTGAAQDRIMLDPGIGFGKTAEHNLLLLRDLKRLAEIGRPLVIGTSRKAFLGRITGEIEPRQRLLATAASVVWSITNQAAIVRVHDVEAMVKVVRVIRSTMAGRPM